MARLSAQNKVIKSEPESAGQLPAGDRSDALTANEQKPCSKNRPRGIICQRSELIAAGYAELIKGVVDVVGCAFDGLDGIDLCRKFQPALLITDMELDHVDGLELCRTVRYELPSTKLLLLSDSFNASRYYAQFLQAGVNAFCLLTSDPQSLLDAIDRAVKGQHYFDEKLKQWISDHATPTDDSSRKTISKEFAVAELIAELALSGSQLRRTGPSKPF